ncbi:MAG: hypothetical protein PF961_14950 [Planctomycetota bacterium]|jgi:type II secretory pathway pseudopilin PulG|nr:hypothetical protein [Planctomycetota bacterium]
MHVRNRPRAAFTLTEVLIVIGVIVALMAMGMPGYWYMVERNRRTSTQTLILAVQAEIGTYGSQVFAWRTSDGQPRTAVLWDVNADDLVDGYVTTDANALGDHYPSSSPLTAAVLAADYQGFVATTGMRLRPEQINEDGHVLDAWGRPLHIAFAPHQFPKTGFRVWSLGPDGQDDSGDEVDHSDSAP